MSTIRTIIYIAILCSSLVCCNESGTVTTHQRDGFSVAYDKVLNAKNPSKAANIISRFLSEEMISEPEEQYLKAFALYNAGEHYDSVMNICEKLLSDKTVKQDKKLCYRSSYLLSNAAYSSGSYSDMVKYSAYTSRLARELNREDDALVMAAAVGYGTALMGHERSGLAMIDDALARLGNYSSWKGKNGYIIALKYKINCLDRMGRIAEIPGVCRNVLDAVGELWNDRLKMEDLPQSFRSDTVEYREVLETYRMQALACASYSYAKTKQRKLAMKYLKEFESSSMSSTIDGKRLIVSALAELGLYDKMLELYTAIDASRGGDTINDSYIDELKYKGMAFVAKGMESVARHYMQRAMNVADSVSMRSNRIQMARNASLYKVQEEQLRASVAESHSRVMIIITASVLIMLLLVLVFAVLQYRQKKTISMKNKKLAHNIEDLYIFKNKYEQLLKGISTHSGNEKTLKTASIPQPNKNEEDSDKELFDSIDSIIQGEQLYLTPDFQRQTLVDKLHVDRNRIGRAIREYSGFANLSAYINNFRLEHAFKQLHSSDASLTIDVIAKNSGFSTTRTFYRLFKEKYGMTPSEFRDNIKSV